MTREGFIVWVFCLLFLSCIDEARMKGIYPLIGSDAMMLCVSNSTESFTQYQWWDDDSSPAHRIFLVGGAGQLSKSGRPKYQNFRTNNTGFPESTAMIIENIQLEDEHGPYRCVPSAGGTTGIVFEVHLEGIPRSVEVNCMRQNNTCPSTVSDSVSSVFTCTCTAVAAYPHTLQLVWTGASESIPSLSMNSSEAGLYDYDGEAVVTPTDVMSEVKCALTGYNNSIDESARSATYTFAPASCTLDVELTPDCKTANLTCQCSGAPNPSGDDLVYGFYDEEGALIGGEQAENEMTLIDLDPNQVNYSFSCRGCNGVNYGEKASATTDVTCIPPYPPVCNVNVKPIDGDCRNVQLKCMCEAEPDKYRCSIYNDSSLIQDSSGCSVIAYVSYDTVTNYTCNATNDAGTGQESSPLSHNCTEETTTVLTTSEQTTPISTTGSQTNARTNSPAETTPTMETKPSGPSSTVLYIIIGAGIAVVIIIVIFLFCCWYCNREGSKDPGSGNGTLVSYQDHNATCNPAYTEDFGAPNNGNVVVADQVIEVKSRKSRNVADDSVDPSALYGKIDKSRKSKKMTEGPRDPHVPSPEKPGPRGDANRRPTETKPEEPSEAAPKSKAAAADVELQYADLDHGRAPPSKKVHQPQDEPTAYAEVNFRLVEV